MVTKKELMHWAEYWRKKRGYTKAEYEENLSWFLGFFNQSIQPTFICYLCIEDGVEEPVIFQKRVDMFNHFVEKHNMDILHFPVDNPHDMNYIILSYLVKALKYSNRKGKQYLRVPCKTLHRELKYRLQDDTISNQQPAHILKKLGMLEQLPTRKKKLGYDKHGNRVFHISKEDIEKAVFESNFFDLQNEFGMLDFDTVYKASKPPSPQSKEDEKKDNKTEETREFKTKKKKGKTAMEVIWEEIEELSSEKDEFDI